MFYSELLQGDVRDALNLHLLYIAKLLENISSVAHSLRGLTKRVVEALLYGAAGEGASVAVTCARLRDLCCALRCLTHDRALSAHDNGEASLSDDATLNDEETLNDKETLNDEEMLKACFSASKLRGYTEAAERTMRELIALAQTLTRAQLQRLFEATAGLFEGLAFEAYMQVPVDELSPV